MDVDDPSSPIKESIKKLYNWITDQQYSGWDIYDGLNSQIFKNIKNPYVSVLILQANKHCPINIRPIFKIKKGIDLKGMAIFAQSYASLYNSTGDDKYFNEMQKTLNFVKEKSLKEKYGYDCWASHYFPYVSIDKSTLSIDVPDIIGTCQAITALIESYKITNLSDEKKMALSATNFLIDELFQEDCKFPFFKYSKSTNNGTTITLNASAKAIEAISSTLNIEDNVNFKSICEKVIRMLLQTQKENGSWDYRISRKGTTKRVQLDFHQGYIIDGLLAYYTYSKHDDSIAECIQKATNYYQNVLFHQDGRSYYRYPLPYPIDIHNQAQGIRTFLKLGKIEKKYFRFAEKITLWTINNMQDALGFFYYQKWPFFSNKIPYMRWGQAWMLLALSDVLSRITSEGLS